MSVKSLERICAGFRTRLKALLFQAGVARLVVLALAVLPALLVLDWWLRLAVVWRLPLLVLYLGGLGVTAWFTLIRPLSLPWTNRQILSHVDIVVPESRGMMLDLYELLHRDEVKELESPVGRELAGAAVDELSPLVTQVAVSRALHRRTAMRWTGIAGLGLALFVGVGIFLPEYLSIGCRRLFLLSNVRWPHRTTITVAEPDSGFLVPQRESLTVKAKVTGEPVPYVKLTYTGKATGHTTTRRLAVDEQGGVAHTFPEVRERLVFTMEGGDYKTEPFDVDIIEQPYLKNIKAHYEPPAYARLPRQTVEGGQLVGLEGTRVRLEFECSMPLQKAVFVQWEGTKKLKPVPMKFISADRTRFEKTLYLSKNGNYQVELYEKHGFREPKPERYEIVVTPDENPEVEITSPARDLIKTARAAVEVAFRARDDFGLEKVEFLYQIDGSAPVPLSTNITGPLKQRGRSSNARFKWDMSKMENLPKRGTITYFVRVKDCNPRPDREPVKSGRWKIKLVTAPELQLEIFERSMRMLNEARIAYREQISAWKGGLKWAKEGTGKEDDELWRLMRDKQRDAFEATKAMESHMQNLVEEYTSNRMEREFMSGRLSAIARYIRRLTGTEHPAIRSGLEQARPKTDLDIEETRLKAQRTKALARFKDRQKMSVLIMERVLRKMYDWRDLQTSSITARLLYERQEEVAQTTHDIAAKYIGKPILDLTDEEQEDLLTLGKQQRSIYETESELEKQLTYMMFKAQKMRRRSILVPLRAAFRLLRNYRVKDHLKKAAEMIENNQPFQVRDVQKRALWALNLTLGALIKAGQQVDQDPKLTLAMDVRPEADLDEPTVVIPKPKGDDDDDDDDDTGGDDDDVVTPGQDVEAGLARLYDPLSAAIHKSLEMQDNVRARTRFLDENLVPEDMPRFRALTRGILLERQARAIVELDKAKKEARNAKARPVEELLAGAWREFKDSGSLISRSNYTKCTQQIQSDTILLLRDLLEQFLPMGKKIKDLVDENRRGNGIDAFDRKYVLRDTNLDAAAAIARRVDHARVAQWDVIRKLKRFTTFRPSDRFLADIERANRARAAEAQKRVLSLLKEVRSNFARISKDVAGNVLEAGVGPILELKVDNVPKAILSPKRDKDTEKELTGTVVKRLTFAVKGLRDLLDERIQPPPETAGDDDDDTGGEPITEQEFVKLTGRKAIQEKLRKDTALPPEVRDRMVRALDKEFPREYDRLLRAYYESFTPKEVKKKPKEKGGESKEADPKKEAAKK